MNGSEGTAELESPSGGGQGGRLGPLLGFRGGGLIHKHCARVNVRRVTASTTHAKLTQVVSVEVKSIAKVALFVEFSGRIEDLGD